MATPAGSSSQGPQHHRQFELDHLAYVTSRPYRRALNARIRRLAQVPAIDRITVVHEDDGRCCQLEPWPVTLGRLIGSLRDDGLRALGVLAP